VNLVLDGIVILKYHQLYSPLLNALFLLVFQGVKEIKDCPYFHLLLILKFLCNQIDTVSASDNFKL
jgi:hypothetical protein